MRIICISRGSYGYGTQLAEKVASKLGCACLSREELTDRATEQGIPVGKIEMTILKHRPLSEALAVEVDRFKAFITAGICEAALKSGVVYHGRTGHLVLPGVSHVLRVRAIADVEERVNMIMRRMNLSREKARTYIDQVDEDRHRWVRTLYNVDWDNPSLYDLTVNAANMSVENSASALVQVAQLPEFHDTPASRRAVEDLLVASRCRLALGLDERTRELKVGVRANQANVTATYLPRQAREAAFIPAVLADIEGIQSLICTVATTSILYVQERFDPETESFHHLVEIAEKWNAAVELVRMADSVSGEPVDLDEPVPVGQQDRSREDGGILDDTPPRIEDCEEMGCGVPETMHRLIQVGRAGASYTVRGGPSELVKSVSRTERYSLIVIGDVFASRGAAVRKRLKRDLIGLLTDQLRVPVIGTEDLKSHFLFGPKQWLDMAVSGLLAVLIYLAVFGNQEAVLGFLSREGSFNRGLAVAAVVAFTPAAALIIGRFAHNVLKLAKLE